MKQEATILSNLESLNAELIKLGDAAADRLQRLNETAIEQMKILVASRSIKSLQPAGNAKKGIA